MSAGQAVRSFQDFCLSSLKNLSPFTYGWSVVWVGEMAQQLRPLVATAEDLGLGSSIYLVADNHCSRGPDALF